MLGSSVYYTDEYYAVYSTQYPHYVQKLFSLQSNCFKK